jgi:photosystem II stability/assembly factor-like uncharacterized protein
MLTTSTGGQTWSKRWSPPDSEVIDVHFLTPKVGWALRNEQKFIYMTMDGGSKWHSEPKDVELPPFRIAAADASHVWVVGGGAIFFRVSD